MPKGEHLKRGYNKSNVKPQVVPKNRKNPTNYSAFALSEEYLQQRIITYMKIRYPAVLIKNDLNGVPLKPSQYVRLRKLGNQRGFPDLAIYTARKGFHGLFLELKTENVKLLNKQDLYATTHLKEQAAILARLTKEGYKAVFACGYTQALSIIDDYLSL